MSVSSRLPILPLNAVLFPDGVLPLRVFEARYMDMARDCLRDDATLGVCSIVSGRNTGAVAQPETIGCEARIVQWDMPQLGVLHVRVEGLKRFRIVSKHTRPDSLSMAEVEAIEPDQDAPLAEQHTPCAAVLKRVIDDFGSPATAKRRVESGNEATELGQFPFQIPYRLDSSVWVGNRLCEILPVPLKAKQKLMELQDAAARLDIITQYLRQHAVIK